MNIRIDHATWMDLLVERAATAPEKLALCYVESNRAEHPITYAQLDARARRMACSLRLHAAPGDRVLLLLHSSIDYVAAFFAALYVGAIPVTGYPPRGGRIAGRIKSIIGDCTPSVILSDKASLKEMERGNELTAIGYRGAMLDIASFYMDWEAEDFVPPEVSTEIALLQYTSGSTSDPKGVMITHANLFHNCRLLVEGMGFGPESVVASWLPLHHDMGLIGKILCSLYAGVPCYFMSPTSFTRSPFLWLQLIAEKRCTISGAPNFAFDACTRRVSEAQRATLDLSCWRVAWNGAEPVRMRTLNQFQEAFAGCGLRLDALQPCYGLAETTLFVTAKPLGTLPVTVSINADLMGEGQFEPAIGTGIRGVDYVGVGITRGGTHLKIVDPVSHASCPDRRIGEIWISNPSVGLGYWRKPEDTAAKFEAELDQPDGRRYFRTGDYGAMLNGELFITGRIKDVFICDGRNIYPQDIEAAIETDVSAIQRSAVFAIDDAVVADTDGVRIVAVCEVEREMEGDVEAMTQICATAAAAAQRENDVALDTILLIGRGRIPRTSSGKVQRALTRASILAKELPIVHSWRTPAALARHPGYAQPSAVGGHAEAKAEINAEHLVEIVCRTAGLSTRAVHTGARALELGLSSLQLHEFIFELESESGRKLDAAELFSGNPSFVEIAKMLSSRSKEDALESHVAIASSSTAVESHRTGQETANTTSSDVSGGTEPAHSTGPGVVLMHEKYQQTVENAAHPFISSLNPEFGRRLAQLKLDKEFVRAEGMYLYDTDGVCYLDFLSQYGSLPFGHNHPEIWDAVMDFHKSRIPAMAQPSLLHLASKLAEKLVAAAPGDIAYMTFANSGAEAIEAAIKLARSSTGRLKILATRNGYHGKTLGALSATGRDKYRKLFGVSPDFHHVPYDDVAALEHALSSGEYAAFIVEPIQGEAGVILPSQSYLPAAQALCRRNGTVFVVDEVQTGIGRTGTMFYSEQLGIEPDIITVAKGLGGGLMPIGACLSSRRVYNDEFGNKHTSTFAGNGLASAIGLRSLDLLQRDDDALMKHVTDIGLRLKRGLIDLQRRYPSMIKAVRGVGLMLAVHVSIDRYRFGSGLLASVAEEDFITSLLMSYLLNHEKVRVAFTLNDGNVLRVQPPLTVGWEECERFIDALDRTLSTLATRNMAKMSAHLVGLGRDDIPDGPVYGEDFLRPYLVEGRPNFGFLLHPLTPKTYVDFDISLGAFNRAQLEHIGEVFGDNFEPFLGGENQLLSDTGEIINGQFWVVPRTAKDLVDMPQRQALMEVQDAMSKAVSAGVKVVGLGAYTSSISHGGLLLNAPDDVIITTGNTFTTLVGYLSIVEALTRDGNSLDNASVAILGATGSIGRALALLLAPRVRKLILVGNPRSGAASIRRMRAICTEILRDDRAQRIDMGPSGELKRTIDRLRADHDDAEILRRLETDGILRLTTSCDEALPLADVVVTATNSPDAVIESQHLKTGAVICDISRPSNVCEELTRERTDIHYFDGGVVRLPTGTRLGLHTDLAEGLSYACMAETMLIALEGDPTLASRGINVDIENIPVYNHLYRKHGFEVYLPVRSRQKAETAPQVAS